MKISLSLKIYWLQFNYFCSAKFKEVLTIFLSGLLGDIILSLDDKYLYTSTWLHGEVRQYDITDREHPKLTGKIQIGGLIAADPEIQVIEDKESKARNSFVKYEL